MCSDESIFEDSEWSENQSGPFCLHYSDPSECDAICKCGHECKNHRHGGCNIDGCDCDDFTEANTDTNSAI